MASEDQAVILKETKKSDQKFMGLKSKKFKQNTGKNNKWKGKSDNFRNAIKAARTGKEAELVADDGKYLFYTSIY